MAKAKFKVGEIYTVSDWTCGGFIRYNVTGRNDKTVSLAEFSDVGFADGQEAYMLPSDYPVKEENGVEYIVIGSHQGYEQRLYCENIEEDWQ